MSANVEPDEVQAILDAVQPALEQGRSSVTARDFAQPLRLSSAEAEALRARVREVLPLVEKEWARNLRAAHALELCDSAELNAETLFTDLAQPFAIVRFEVGGQPGWARWDVGGALAAIEAVLGAPEPSAEPRPLSTVERAILVKLLRPLVERVAQALGLEAKALRVPAKLEEVGTWRDGGPLADRQRVRVSAAFDGPGGASTIDLILPGLGSASPAAGPEPAAALPAHLAPVSVELAAHLGSVDIALSELLRLEEGDVIPLDVPINGPLSVHVEDVECAAARLGTHHGNLAIRIERIGRVDPNQP